MRKRIVITLIAVVAIGIGAYALSQPKKGTVEWYKQRALHVDPTFRGWIYGSKVNEWYYRLTGDWLVKYTVPELEMFQDEFTKSINKLEELGYLERSLVVFTNAGIGTACLHLQDAATAAIPKGIWNIELAGTNALFVIRPREDREIWERLIRETDVPESK